MKGLAAAASTIDSRWLLVALLFALDVWAIGLVFASRATRREKVLWTVILIFCPIVGCLLWYVLGPKPWLLKREERSRRPS